MSENRKNMTNEELEKLKEKDMDKVSGGYFGFDKDHTDGHELTCVFSTTFHKKNECDKSPDGYHFYFEDEHNLRYETCKYCYHIRNQKTNGATRF